MRIHCERCGKRMTEADRGRVQFSNCRACREATKTPEYRALCERLGKAMQSLNDIEAER